MIHIHAAPLVHLEPAVLYQILRLRTDVFVVEQACAYPELDGRDLEPTAVQLWAQDGGDVVATLRILSEDHGLRIGRVAVARDHRGTKLGSMLMGEALEQVGPRSCVLDAQAHLEHWYRRFGFEVCGPAFVEDGIPHVPMRRASGGHSAVPAQGC